MPFPEAARTIACRLEIIGYRPFGQGQADIRQLVAPPDRIEFVSEARLVAAGHQTRARRAAQRRADVAVRKPHAAPGNGVDMGSRDLRIPLAAKFSVAEIVRDDQYDIRLAGRRSLSEAPGKCGEKIPASHHGG